MKKFFFLLVGASSLLIASNMEISDWNNIEPCADIRAVTSLIPIQKELETCNEDTLVLLDIGGTLLIRKDPVLHVSYENWKKMWFERHYPQMTREETFSLIRVVQESDTSWQLLDAWPELIHQAQKRKAKVVAFTKVLIDPSVQNFRGARLLMNFGLLIQDDLPELSDRGIQFIYEPGVIQTGEKFKGPVLKEVLQKVTKVPHKIVFVDDRKEQLESVQQACNEVGVPVVCFHYTSFENPPPLDEAVANYQLHALVKEHRWIPTEEINKGEACPASK